VDDPFSRLDRPSVLGSSRVIIAIVRIPHSINQYETVRLEVRYSDSVPLTLSHFTEKTSMGKSFSTLLLAVGAFLMVGAGAFLIATTALGDDDDDAVGPGADVSGEQHVLLQNLGMT
jgi:hypothetical protein